MEAIAFKQSFPDHLPKHLEEELLVCATSASFKTHQQDPAPLSHRPYQLHKRRHSLESHIPLDIGARANRKGSTLSTHKGLACDESLQGIFLKNHSVLYIFQVIVVM